MKWARRPDPFEGNPDQGEPAEVYSAHPNSRRSRSGRSAIVSARDGGLQTRGLGFVTAAK